MVALPTTLCCPPLTRNGRNSKRRNKATTGIRARPGPPRPYVIARLACRLGDEKKLAIAETGERLNALRPGGSTGNRTTAKGSRSAGSLQH